jgi:hypothetical protein
VDFGGSTLGSGENRRGYGRGGFDSFARKRKEGKAELWGSSAGLGAARNRRRPSSGPAGVLEREKQRGRENQGEKGKEGGLWRVGESPGDLLVARKQEVASKRWRRGILEAPRRCSTKKTNTPLQKAPWLWGVF